MKTITMDYELYQTELREAKLDKFAEIISHVNKVLEATHGVTFEELEKQYENIQRAKAESAIMRYQFTGTWDPEKKGLK